MMQEGRGTLSVLSKKIQYKFLFSSSKMLLDQEKRKASIIASLQALGQDSAKGRKSKNSRRKMISDLSPSLCHCLPPGKLMPGSNFSDGVHWKRILPTGPSALGRRKLTNLGKKPHVPKGRGYGTWTPSQFLQHILSPPLGHQASERPSRFKSDLLFRFKKAAKCIVMLCLLYKEHHLRANLSYGIERVRRRQLSSSHMEQSREEILFDVTLFRAKKQARISQRAIFILHQCPQERSEKDISYMLITLQPVKAFGNYSTRIQKEVAKVAWYSRYESCQVMIQQGYAPHSFYICLSGSATVIRKNHDNGQLKPAWFFSQGDAFGDQEIINGDSWQGTVIIQEPAEFLCIDQEDFIRIFLSDARKVLGDPEQLLFLRSLRCFEGWPVHLLEGNPGKYVVCHYRRGSVVLRNSNATKWIYIVKAGSCSVLKVFKDDLPTTGVMEAGAGRSSMMTPMIIAVDTLLQGSVFGLLDFLFEDQPSLCVVSNGAECLKISKKFFLHHASKDLLERLRKEEHSYPSEAKLKEQLQRMVQWQVFRKAALANTIQRIELKHNGNR
ncbi:PREDICTED: uncharacterized protein LOC109311135 [Crocodylus porosus]|uniref:uncharacterized protein LOC109311135 n=1 Tax=Crocodylus porosus TaxID=8502 RepID=UPI00093F9DDD|nr:PREDICTED: uncharacterized protein LOC109311135 [Crocodylus porosus]